MVTERADPKLGLASEMGLEGLVDLESASQVA